MMVFDFVTSVISVETFCFTKEQDRVLLGIKIFHRSLQRLRKVGFVPE